jgi:FkbM family methyltransferase
MGESTAQERKSDLSSIVRRPRFTRRALRSVAWRIWALVERLHPLLYVRVFNAVALIVAWRRSRPVARVALDNQGRAAIRNAGTTLYIASHLRAPRYLSRGIAGVYEMLLRRYFPEGHACLSGAVVVDVGANVGEFSLACLEAGASSVIAIEPDPDAAACLRMNLAGAMPGRAAIHEVAAAASSGEQTFYRKIATADSSLIRPENPSHVVRVRTTRLDDLLGPSIVGIDVLKVEAEGAEPEVLEGATALLAHVPFVTVRASSERQGMSTFPACEEILGKAGYRCRASGDGEQLLAFK